MLPVVSRVVERVGDQSQTLGVAAQSLQCSRFGLHGSPVQTYGFSLSAANRMTSVLRIAGVMQPLTAYSLIALIIESSRPGEFHPRFGAELGWQAVASPSSQSYTSRHPAQSRLSIPNHPKLVRGYSESYSDRLGCICGPSRRRATWDVLALRFAGRAFQQRIGFVARIAIPCFERLISN